MTSWMLFAERWNIKMKKRLVIIMISVVLMNVVHTLPVFASERASVQKDISVISKNDITPYADVIERKYRIYNGVRQYRRWNATKKRWVDSHWINIK